MPCINVSAAAATTTTTVSTALDLLTLNPAVTLATVKHNFFYAAS